MSSGATNRLSGSRSRSGAMSSGRGSGNATGSFLRTTSGGINDDEPRPPSRRSSHEEELKSKSASRERASVSSSSVGRSTGSYGKSGGRHRIGKSLDVMSSPTEPLNFEKPTITPNRGIPEDSTVKYSSRNSNTSEITSRSKEKSTERMLAPSESLERRERRRRDGKERRRKNSRGASGESSEEFTNTPPSRERRKKSSSSRQSGGSSEEFGVSSAERKERDRLKEERRQRRRAEKARELERTRDETMASRGGGDEATLGSTPSAVTAESADTTRTSSKQRKERRKKESVSSVLEEEEEGRRKPSRRSSRVREAALAAAAKDVDSVDATETREERRHHSSQSASFNVPTSNDTAPPTLRETKSDVTSSQLARNRLRERMLGELDGSSGSSRDRVKAILSLDTPRSKRKGEMPTLSETAAAEPRKVHSSERSSSRSAEKSGSRSSQKDRTSRKSKREEEKSKPKPEIAVADTSSEDDDGLPLDEDSAEWTESSGGDGHEEQWSVRVSVLSAVDLPSSIVPNMPLCPVLKFGLVTIPASEDIKNSPVLTQVETSGLSSVAKSRVRCTSTKILAKRDNGAVEFHEEMRWDSVKRPMRTALAVELCARAVLPPPNAHESPMPKSLAKAPPQLPSPRQFSPPENAASVRVESDNTRGGSGLENPGFAARSKSMSMAPAKPAEEEESNVGGIAGMRALWRKGRKNLEQQRTKVGTAQPGNEEATAAAAVARFLVGGSPGDAGGSMASSDHSGRDATKEDLEKAFPTEQPLIGENVALVQERKKKEPVEMADDLRLRSLVIPLTRLNLEKATSGGEAARIEQWYQMDGGASSQSNLQWQESQRGPSLQRRNPSILLEIIFAPPKVLDQEDDKADSHQQQEDSNNASKDPATPGGVPATPESGAAASPATPLAPVKPADPLLEPGVVDFVCVVGAKDIGNQRNDNGAKGWVNSTPEFTLLERFPPTDEYHINNGRMTGLPDKIEWFCFPEGCKLWRGPYPPTHNDLNLKRYSASAPPNVASSSPVFDACLNCATSFVWWVLQSNSDDYQVENKKTFGACIRFYAPAPPGIDPTQDDFAQSFLAGQTSGARKRAGSTAKRLWVPLGICLISSLPIVGVMESMLLRICEQISSQGSNVRSAAQGRITNLVHQDLANLLINFQRPVPGVLHCSIPFLQGDRLHLTLPPPGGLPSLPHGSSVTMVCRLLGAEGLNVLLAAVLTECKIVIHSDDIANLGMVGEVITSLIYPFQWALPYIPVLPEAMLEFVEAPLSFFLGMPTSSLKLLDPEVLADVVVVDLDNGYASPDYFDGRRNGKATKTPTSLPASVASNISKAVFRLLREEEEVEEQYGAVSFPGARSIPRLEAESLAEREFRIAVALQICGLVRGYQECLIFVSASQPVFNRDRFLRNAPALFEDRRGNLPAFANPVDSMGGSQRMLSPRSKRFLSLLVNTQHFHGLLDCLGLDSFAFFHEVMESFDMIDDQGDPRSSSVLSGYGSSKLEAGASHLSKSLQKIEDKIPTYKVNRTGKKKKRGGWDGDDDGFTAFENFLDGSESVVFGNDTMLAPFTNDLLQPISTHDGRGQDGDESITTGNSDGVHSLSIEYMVKLEKNPWEYQKLFQIPLEAGEIDGPNGKKIKKKPLVEVRDKVKLRDAIGERRYRAWKIAQEEKMDNGDESTVISTKDLSANDGQNDLDLSSLLSSAANDFTSDTASMSSANSDFSFSSKRSSGLTPEQQRVADAKDRDVLRRCLERAYDGSSRRSSRRSSAASSDSFVDNGRDLISEAETALRNPSAQRFLVSVLSQRSRIESRKKERFSREDAMRGSRHHRQSNQSSVSRLQPVAFECLVRLCCAMLDSCMEDKDFLPAYRLLTHTAGFCTVRARGGGSTKVATPRDGDDHDSNSQVIYMTARIGLHPIFADLRLWETVLGLHLQDRQNEKGGTRSGSNSGVSSPTESLSGSGTSNKIPSELLGTLQGKASNDAAEYEAAVATLYEMLGFGIPAEEMARFANRVSEKYGWFSTERGHSFLMLARRLSVRRDEVEDDLGGTEDLDMLRGRQEGHGNDREALGGGLILENAKKLKYVEIGWSHPAANLSRQPRQYRDEPRTASPRGRRRSGYESLDVSGEDDIEMLEESLRLTQSADTVPKYLERTAVTTVAAFGSNMVASGGVDGSVFLAHSIGVGRPNASNKDPVVCGVRLEVGDADLGSGMEGSAADFDGEKGAISCLAAAKGAGYRPGHAFKSEISDKEEFIGAMEGCRIVAGTTSGDLKVWSVKEVYAATSLKDDHSDISASLSEMRIHHGARDNTTSSYLSPRSDARDSLASLKGRSLSGHRGGVSCMDVPSHVYRPDTLVTGGVDGLIKLWSLRKHGNRRSSANDTASPSGRLFGRNSNLGSPDVKLTQRLGRDGDGSDALGVLTGHGGRVTTLRAAWHGDRLISGGADRTVRFWDIAGSGGKCLNTMSGHHGWVTQTHYWGPHTVVSASTDRSIAMWDVRSHNSPLFVLRYHLSPISDLLVGSRTDPLMVSAGCDGTIATWDFRTLSVKDNGGSEGSKSWTVRQPMIVMTHGAESKRNRCSGGVLLSRGSGPQNAISVGIDASMKEWDIATGKLMRQDPTHHCDVVTSLCSLTDTQKNGTSADATDRSSSFGGTVTGSWDGTVRMRRLIRK